MPYSLPLSSNPEYVALPPLGVPLTPEQDAALFAGDIAAVARVIFQGILAELATPEYEQHTAIPSTLFVKDAANAR